MDQKDGQLYQSTSRVEQANNAEKGNFVDIKL